ncbi:MAG: DNA repair protein RecN [Actinobacteria bacterium]|nr:DNA repair protein RecN [Actinomycetota bacterium]
MLKEIEVKNFALIDDVTVKFGKGLNILTGETGAGKTLIIEAINFLIGERADSDLIRDNEDKLIVQGYFDLSNNEKANNYLKTENLLDENDSADDIAITREINKNGKNRAFVNGIFVQLNILKNLGKYVLDLNGQHDHQYLLDQNTHIDIVDDFGGEKIDSLKSQHADNYGKFFEIRKELESLQKQQNEKDERLLALKYRLDEIQKLSMTENEEEELEQEKNILKNYEKIHNLCGQSLDILKGTEKNGNEDFSLSDNSSVLGKNITELANIDNKFRKYSEGLEEFSIFINELLLFLNSYIAGLEYSAEKLDKIQERLYRISEIKRKYQMDISQINAYAKKIKQEIDNFENLDSDITQKNFVFEEVKKILRESAIALSEKRKEVIKILENEVFEELSDLNLKNAFFKVRNEIIITNDQTAGIEINNRRVKIMDCGIDYMEFLISLNPGESAKPLRKIASGGEISRIMLALKSIISKIDNISTLVFDEIDTGIGGATAVTVGKKLHKISKNCQVICITHLPQIAAFSDYHYFIEKLTEKGRTKIRINRLDTGNRVKEISRMLSGMEDSNISVMHAEELLEQTNRIKKDLKEEKVKVGN